MAAVRSQHHLLPILFITLSLCNLPVSLSADTEALLRLKRSLTNGETALVTWVPNVFPCGNWAGVVCFDNVITGLHLSDMGLSGNIDVQALTEIHGLRTLSFVNNSFTGPIPEFSKLGTIKSLLLSHNHFSGPIPSEFFSPLGSLKKVWLDSNSFSGEIPESLTALDLLRELHLENNLFSGQIPNLKQDLTSFDASNNNLEGPIPESLSKFDANSFGGSGNEKLCGKPLEKTCDGYSYSYPSTAEDSYASSWAVKVILIMLFAALAAVIFMFVKSRRRRDEDLGVMGRMNSVESMVEVHVPSSNHRGAEPVAAMAKKGGGESKRGSAKGSGGMGDIVMVNDEKGVFGLSVVVKRMREMNKIGKEVFDAEMRQFGRIRHKNILAPLAYHYRREEKLYVTEYMPKGSLLYVLHGDRGTCHADLNWPTRLKIVKGIARGLGFLYTEFSTYDLPHGNLKSSNVLLSDDYEPLLGDFAFHPLINPTVAVQAMFAYKSPDYIQYQKVSQKTDVYCLGVIILEIITGKFPSQYHSNGKGGTDVVQWVLTAISERREAELIDPEFQDNTGSQDQMLQLLHIGAACTESNPDQRLSMKEAIRRIEEVQEV